MKSFLSVLLLFSMLTFADSAPAASAKRGSLFSCGVDLGGEQFTYQPSAGWKKPLRDHRELPVIYRESYANGIYRAMQRRAVKIDRRIEQPTAIMKMGCSWR